MKYKCDTEGCRFETDDVYGAYAHAYQRHRVRRTKDDKILRSYSREFADKVYGISGEDADVGSK